MPTNRRRMSRHRSNRHELSVVEYAFFFEVALDDFIGHRWQALTLSGARGGDAEKYRDRWYDYQEVILAEFIGLHPGQRPYPWWYFDAPEPRRLLHGRPCLDWETERRIWGRESGVDLYLHPRRRYGIPGRLSRTSTRVKDDRIYESQAIYLDRLGMLLPGELLRIPPPAWEPFAAADLDKNNLTIAAKWKIGKKTRQNHLFI